MNDHLDYECVKASVFDCMCTSSLYGEFFFFLADTTVPHTPGSANQRKILPSPSNFR